MGRLPGAHGSAEPCVDAYQRLPQTLVTRLALASGSAQSGSASSRDEDRKNR
jgi:hypothetical protein